jgi:transcription antitermination protein NusB
LRRARRTKAPGRGRLPSRRPCRVPEPVRDHPIMTRRSRGREVALQVLYQVEQNAGIPLPEVRRFIQRRLLGDRKLCEFTEGLIAGVKQHQARIDALISEAAENWRIDRMAAIDRNILRLGVFEMMFCQEVPARVAINEALELAKRYSTAQSSRFVNGILDRLLQSQVASARTGRDPESAAPEPEAGAAAPEEEGVTPAEETPSDTGMPPDETPPE